MIIPKSLIACLIVPIALAAYDAEILRYTSICRIDHAKLRRTDSVAVQINNRAGDCYAAISIPYASSDKVSDLAGWIETVDGGKVRQLRNRDISDISAVSEVSLYQDQFLKRFELKHNTYPYTFWYTYTVTRGLFIDIGQWSPVLGTDIPTRQARLQLIVPKDYPFQYHERNIAACRKDSSDDGYSLEWAASYENPLKTEIFSQPEREMPSVCIVPQKVLYGVEGRFNDWKNFGDWQNRLMQNLDDLPVSEKEMVATLVKGLTDKRAIVRTAYHYLQDHTRYINVSIGIGGFKPYPASYVSLNKYGDCKALTNYLKAILKQAGIESYCADVYAGDQPVEIIKTMAGPQFNHMVLAVPLDADTLWLETTDNINPFGYVGTFIQNREALLVAAGSSRLVRIPALSAASNHVSNRLVFDCMSNGDAQATLAFIFRGRGFERYAHLRTDFNARDKDEIIKELMPFDNCDVIDWELNHTDRDSAQITLNAKVTIRKLLTPLGKELYFSLYPLSVPPFEIPANRKLPVSIPYPLYRTDTLTYNAPSGYIFNAKPDSFTVRSAYGAYSVRLTPSKNSCRAIKRFELFPGNYSAQKYTEFYTFIQSIKDADKMKIVVAPGR
jgi:hypothetical protein